MKKKYRIIIVIALIFCVAIGRICYYALPLKPPHIEEVNECSLVELKIFHHSQETAKSTEERSLAEEEILKLQNFLESSTFSRKHAKDQIGIDFDKSLHITFTWSDGRYAQLRTFGENSHDSDVLVWDSGKILFLQAHDENWHKALEKLLTE